MFIPFALDLFTQWLPAALIGAAASGSLLALSWLFADGLRRPSWPRGRQY